MRRYSIFVKFNSSVKIHVEGNEIIIALKSKPERNKANRELIEKLAQYSGTSNEVVNLFDISDQVKEHGLQTIEDIKKDSS